VKNTIISLGGFDLKRSVTEEVGNEVEYISFGDDFIDNSILGLLAVSYGYSDNKADHS